MGALKNWWLDRNEPTEAKAVTSSAPPLTSGSGIYYGIGSGSLTPKASSAYYEMMAEQMRREERNQAMIKLADKLGLKSAEDVENLMKEIGLE